MADANESNKLMVEVVTKHKAELKALKKENAALREDFDSFRNLVKPFFDKYQLADAVLDKVRDDVIYI